MAGGAFISNFATVPGNSAYRARLSCPGGQRAISGGFTFSGHDADGFNIGAFVDRMRIASMGPGPNHDWTIILRNETGNTTIGDVWAQCVPE